MIEILAALVAKSLVVADHAANAEPEYYLLGTTRAYSLAKLIESGEIETVRRRYAEGDQEIAEGQPAEIAEREAMTYSSLACELEEIGCVVRPQDDSATRVALIASSVSTRDWQGKRGRAPYLSMPELHHDSTDTSVDCGANGLLFRQ